jgi:hypothetical protein
MLIEKKWQLFAQETGAEQSLPKEDKSFSLFYFYLVIFFMQQDCFYIYQ